VGGTPAHEEGAAIGGDSGVLLLLNEKWTDASLIYRDGYAVELTSAERRMLAISTADYASKAIFAVESFH
jgi:hypothetical protein